MAFVKLSTTQVAILSNLADNEVDTGPVFKEFVATIKQQYGIPAEHKLRTGSSNHFDAAYPILYRKKTGVAYEINPETGRWVGAAAPVGPTTRAPYVPQYRHFHVETLAEIDDIIGTITADLDFEDGETGHTETATFEIDNYEFRVCTDGQLYIRLEKGEF